MLQPVGRVLGSSAFNSVWLRASPIICALDTLTFIVRLLAYCIFLRATLREALLIIGKDRFDEDEIDHGSQRTTITTTLRRVGFFLSVLPPIYMVGAWGQFRWTVAWVWMYFASYIVLEIASQLARHELSQPQYTATDFELESLGEADGDDASLTESTGEAAEDEASDQAKLIKGKTQDESKESPGAKYTQGNTSSEVGSMNDEIDDYTIHEMDFLRSASTEHLLGKTSDEDQNIPDNSGYSLTQVETTEAAPRTGPSSDLEAAEDSNSKYEDPLTSRLLYLKYFFDFWDVLFLRWGCLFNAIFVYWAFLDLIHPPLHTYILSSVGWGIVIVFLKIPFLCAAVLFIVFASYLAANGLATGIAALGRFVGQYFSCTCEKGWVGKSLLILALAAVALGLYGGGLGTFWVLMQLLLVGDFTQFIYSLLAVETVVLLIFSSICFGLHRLFKFTAEITSGARQRFKISRYFGENGVALATCVIVAFTVSTVWYRFRFPSSAEWVENWREALMYNTTLKR